MIINLRLEQPNDYRIVEEVTREAFWGRSNPSCDEHFLAHKIRQIQAFVPELDYIAIVNDKIVGNVMYVKGKIINNSGKEFEVLDFGPLSVLPEYQNKGIGKALMNHTITKAKELGYKAIFFFGEPDYYPRLGFQRAEVFHISPPWGTNFDAFMAMPLFDGALDGITGRFYEDPVYNVNAKEAAEFEKTFSFKEKCVLASINVLIEKLTSTAKETFQKNKITLLADLRNYSGREVASWQGINKVDLSIINLTLKEYGYAQKIWPNDN